MDLVKRYQIDQSNTIRLTLFRNVTNIEEIHRALIEGEIQCSLIDPLMIVDIFQLQVAAFRAVKNKQSNTMKTKSVYTEILYALSPSRSISVSLKTIGIKDASSEVAILTVNDDDVEEMKKICGIVKGEQISIDELPNFSDKTTIMQQYDVSETELQVGSLLDSVVCKMATKELKNR